MSDYYCQNPQSYHEKTYHVDPSPFLKPFVVRLPSACKILDVGCASGRDLLWLKEREFSVRGFERSPGLVKLARKNTGCNIIQGDFEAFDFEKLSVDAILLIGALVHVPHKSFPRILSRIMRALKKEGLMLLSLKEGRDKRSDSSGRTFYLWKHENLQKTLSDSGLRILDFFRQASSMGTDEIWLTYILEKV